MLFKAWKSHFQLEVISQNMSQSQLEVAIYCKLLVAVHSIVRSQT
jgi:hypothetical protein